MSPRTPRLLRPSHNRRVGVVPDRPVHPEAALQGVGAAGMRAGVGLAGRAAQRVAPAHDASRWHDRLIWRAERKRVYVNPNSRFIMSYALVSGSLSNLWVMLRLTKEGALPQP